MKKEKSQIDKSKETDRFNKFANEFYDGSGNRAIIFIGDQAMVNPEFKRSMSDVLDAYAKHLKK